MYVLDTDHLSLIQRNGVSGQKILTRLSMFPTDDVVTTVISYEEQVKGRLLFLSRAKTVDDVTIAYRGLQQLAADYREITMLAFDAAAFAENSRLRRLYPRLGAMDLKIAAIALSRQAVLLTRNRRDFGNIEGLDFEDWS
jgi:tRNA(fMet)-specific endonuclease VapC